MCQIFKAKYFPTSSFLEADLGSNPSFSWRGIVEARNLVQRGLRWKVGDRSEIRVWGQPWLADNRSFFIQTPRMHGLQEMRVKDLMLPGARAWNMQTINQIFNERDRRAILKTPISPNGHADKWTWHFERNGLYSVKSGYKLADSLTRDEGMVLEGEWNKIWKSLTPPKVTESVWRICRDVLPTRSNLIIKRVATESSCVICDGGPETIWHIFFNCDYAKECWAVAGLTDKIEECIHRVESTREMILTLLEELSSPSRESFAMILWQIWSERNAKYWEGSLKTATRAVMDALSLISEWQNLRTRQRSTTSNKCEAWPKPHALGVKINVDAAFFDDANEMGIRMVLRDDQGAFVAARTLRCPGLFEVEIGEAMGFLEALSWGKNLNLENVIIEGDSKVVVDAINTERLDNSTFGDIIRNCKSLKLSINRCCISFVRRNANSVAHSLARASRHYESPCLWNEPPEFVESLPIVPCVAGTK